MTEAETSMTEAENITTETVPKMCMIDDAEEIEKLSSAPTTTCGMCGAKAHDAVNVCEAGIHSDLL